MVDSRVCRSFSLSSVCFQGRMISIQTFPALPSPQCSLAAKEMPRIYIAVTCPLQKILHPFKWSEDECCEISQTTISSCNVAYR